MQKQEEKNEEKINTDKKDIEIESDIKANKEYSQKENNNKDEKISNESNSISEKKDNKIQVRKKGVIKTPVVITGIVIALAIIFSVIFALININNDKIISGISINDIEVSGLTKEEAKGKIETIINEKKQKEINLKYQEYETQVNPELIEVNYDVEKAIDTAYNIGRNSNIFVNNYNILFTLIGKNNVNININLNENILRQTLSDASSNLPGAIKESSYYIDSDELIITKGKKGVYIDIDDALYKIKQNLNDLNNNNKNDIEMLVVEKEPEAIDIDKIHEEVFKEAKDAYYTKEPFQVFPEVEGVDFNVEEAKQLLKEDKEEYIIKLTITKPKVTMEQIGSEAFPDRLAVFTTRYDASNIDRTTNLRIACQKINGKVVLPGENFSYNKTLGERTIAAGYKEAKIYANGEVVDGLGGGICQISSTLYNAVLMSNLDIVERRNHQFVTSYLPAGRDATVVYGLTDFKFKNTRKYPIKINANVQNGIATVEIYGIKEETEYVISLDTRTIGTIPVTTKYVEDPSLESGMEKIKQKGTNGVQTETYITKSLNGKIVSRNLLSKDTYNAMQRIVIRGTKSATVTPAPVQTPTVTPSEPVVVPETPANNQQPSEPVENTNINSETPNTQTDNTN